MTWETPTWPATMQAVAASKVAAIPAVRAAVLDFQRDFAINPPGGAGGAVIDGRDIGTVVCPDAAVKLFVTASVEARAERRHKELLGRGEASIYARVLQDLKERDARDTNRAVAPLRPAEDAEVMDTSEMDPDAAFAAAFGVRRGSPYRQFFESLISCGTLKGRTPTQEAQASTAGIG